MKKSEKSVCAERKKSAFTIAFLCKIFCHGAQNLPKIFNKIDKN